jgi:hypothetical protein
MDLTLLGEGWKEKLAEPTDQHDSPPNKHIVVKVGALLLLFIIVAVYIVFLAASPLGLSLNME